MKPFPAFSPNTSTQERFDSSIGIFLEPQADRRCIRPLAARCANDQGAYWPMHDRLFNSGGEFEISKLRDYAKRAQFECDRVFRHAWTLNVTPRTFLKTALKGETLEFAEPRGLSYSLPTCLKTSEILLIPGAFPFDVFQEEIDKLLALASQAGTSTEFPSSTSGRRSLSKHLAICHQLAYS